MDGDKSLLGKIKQLIDSGGLELPIFDGTASKLQSLTSKEDVNVEEVEELVLADQVLVAEVLRAANSPFFGGLARIHTIRNAVVRLGMHQVSHLVFLASHRSKYSAKAPDLRPRAQKLWEHASAVAMAASWLTRKLGFRKLEDESFLGGLLHDVGQLVILRAIDEIKLANNTPFGFSPQLIDEVMHGAHTELGYNLLKHWDIPALYCDIARDHHFEEFDPSNIPLVAVRLANHSACKMGLGLKEDPSIVLSALPEAHCLGAGEILMAELEIMLEDTYPSVTQSR